MLKNQQYDSMTFQELLAFSVCRISSFSVQLRIEVDISSLKINKKLNIKIVVIITFTEKNLALFIDRPFHRNL